MKRMQISSTGDVRKSPLQMFQMDVQHDGALRLMQIQY
jgi:hypothetical protein